MLNKSLCFNLYNDEILKHELDKNNLFFYHLKTIFHLFVINFSGSGSGLNSAFGIGEIRGVFEK